MSGNVYDYMDWPRIEAIVYGEESSPKDVMGPRLTTEGVLIQGFFPGAEEAEAVVGRKSYPMEMEDEAGYFAVLIPGRKIPSYKFRVTRNGEKEVAADPYAFPGQITEEEEKAFCAGVYYHAYEKLGAHPVTVEGVQGTSFAVWAPNAVSVSVTGDFNNWDGRGHLMHRMPMSGIFELFIPGVMEGDLYKYEIRVKGGQKLLKTDPYGMCTEAFPATASVVARAAGDIVWEDGSWMKARVKYAEKKLPVSIYETSLDKWENTSELVNFVKKLGYTHVELHPVMGYLDEESGPYSTFSYYAPDRRFGMPGDFAGLVNELHKAEIGVILDWTPAHFPRHAEGLECFDGTPLYEVQDPEAAVHPMWGTLLYNYESPMVADFLIANAFYWTEVYHADGLRLDDVDAMLYLDYGRENGGWKPNIYGSSENLAAVEFLKHLNSIMKKKNPGVLMIAQEDGLWPEITDSVENDHIGFDYKWNNNWSADFLHYLSLDPIERQYDHDQLTLSMLYAYCEHYVLTLGTRDAGELEAFMEKLPGSEAQKLAQVRAAYTYQMLHPGLKMTAPGKEIPREMETFIHDLNELYCSRPALWQRDNEYEGFEWVQLMKYEENILTFMRKTEKPEETLLAVVNFAAVPYENYQFGVPFYGKYKEIFNSDRKEYGGEGTINPRAKTCRAEACDEREHSLRLRIPALGAVILSCTLAEKTEKKPVRRSSAKKTEKAEAGKPAAEKKLAARKKAEPAAQTTKETKTAKTTKAVKTTKTTKAAKTTAKKTAV